MAANKYYAIRKGRQNNVVVNSWDECEKLTKGYPSEYKGFTVQQDAYDWINVDSDIDTIAKQIINLLEQNNMNIYFNMQDGIFIKDSMKNKKKIQPYIYSCVDCEREYEKQVIAEVIDEEDHTCVCKFCNDYNKRIR